MHIEKKYLWFPVDLRGTARYLSVYCKENKILEFHIPFYEEEEAEYQAMYFASVPVSAYTGGEIGFEGDFPETYLKAIRNEDEPYYNNEKRPKLHFTANCGWINDPNGLVYDGEYYHLYYQFNPFACVWDNMCWGHARSRDLLHWRQEDPVMMPDEDGMIFSGSGIKKDDKLYFFYTAAGVTPWSSGKLPVQRMAISSDGGMTLHKEPGNCVDVINKETRDPKVFWHEESQAYIMVLYLGENDFGIFRSIDLYHWKATQRFSLEQAWECPDLIRFSVHEQDVWMFTVADGFCFFGTFDGYQFQTDGISHPAYATDTLYAAQSYSGVHGRVLFVPWLRLHGTGNYYNGAMGYPRELSLGENAQGYYLRLKLAREVEQAFVITDHIPAEGPYMMQISSGLDRNFAFSIGDSFLSYLAEERTLFVDGEKYTLLPTSHEIFMAVDYHILEITQGDEQLLGAYLLQGNTNRVTWQIKAETMIYQLKELLWQY